MIEEAKVLPIEKGDIPAGKGHLAWEWGGIAFLGIIIAWLLRISWRKWPDPLVDFGRELYLPWRLGEGAVLYRDMDGSYGPLSHYFNALIFGVTGVGYMHLVWANLLIYCAILTLIYRGLRMGWGRLAAFAGSLVFVTAFSFNQLVGIGNYNFVSPYSHEATHGFLLILILVHLWASWLQRPRFWKIAPAGLCCGLCVLLKVEIIFAAVVVTIGGVVLAFRGRKDLRRLQGWMPIALPYALATGLPSLVATLMLWRSGGFSFIQAFSWANIGWTGLLVYRSIVVDPLQMEFLGVADLPGNLAAIVVYGGVSVAAIIGLAAMCRGVRSRKGVVIAGLSLAAAFGLVSYWLPWMGWGTTFPAWLCLALFIALRKGGSARQRPEPAAAHSARVRWFFLLAAGAFLARMSLNPRIFHYGFYQAALTGVVVAATGFRSLPDLFSLRGGSRYIYQGAFGVFLGLGLWSLEERSREILSLKTQPIGEGADQFFGFSAEVNANSALLESARVALSAKTDCHSLLVIPEGVMLNYLLRKPNPISAYSFTSDWLYWRDHTLDSLRRAPPDYVVMISRDMNEFGMDHFGDSPEHGEKILAWIRGNYGQVWQAGGNPLGRNEHGVVVLRRVEEPGGR